MTTAPRPPLGVVWAAAVPWACLHLQFLMACLGSSTLQTPFIYPPARRASRWLPVRPLPSTPRPRHLYLAYCFIISAEFSVPVARGPCPARLSCMSVLCIHMLVRMFLFVCTVWRPQQRCAQARVSLARVIAYTHPPSMHAILHMHMCQRMYAAPHQLMCLHA